MPDGARLDGVGVVVTAGGTREPIDPVRYLGNRSSGKMGGALAEAAVGMGAKVTLVTTVDPPAAPAAAGIVRVDTAEEMRAAVHASLAGAQVLVMAAAVADYQPAEPSVTKLKKRTGTWSLLLVPTVDILASLRDDPVREGVYVVGFAAETDDLIVNAKAKLRAKGLDLIVVNDVGRPGIGMGADDNEVTLVDASGVVKRIERSPKREVAGSIMRVVAQRLPR